MTPTPRKGKTDPSFDREARTCSALLEAGDERMVALWRQFRSLSAASYDKVYSRLGVNFDLVTSESEYNTRAKEVATLLRNVGALTLETNGAEIVDLTSNKLGHARLLALFFFSCFMLCKGRAHGSLDMGRPHTSFMLNMGCRHRPTPHLLLQ